MTGQPEDGGGAVRSMQNALNSAGVSPDAVQYINAHGTSTPINDPNETLAIKRCFGDHASALAVSSTKSMTGHLLGAAGGLEAGIGARDLPSDAAADHQSGHAGSRCDLDYVPNIARPASVTYALSNSFGFGGTNASLLLKKYEGKVSGHGSSVRTAG